MKKAFLILTFLLAAALVVPAQNNAYGIDDECFPWFRQAEHSLDDFESDSFDVAMQNLLETSVRKKDSKAQAIYYTEIVKRLSHEAQAVRKENLGAWDSTQWNARMEEARETAQRIAKASGYMQYYYYASELCQTYYFNTKQDIQAAEMLTAMMEEAEENGDEYGTWKSLMYLGKLYLRISDNHSTKKYLKKVVNMYETSLDPTIRRQAMVVQYCDLADTYPVASDSARLYYGKAMQAMTTGTDSIRVAYYQAQLAAWDNNLPEYRRNRDYCLSMRPFAGVIRGGTQCFTCIDYILAGAPASKYAEDIKGLYIRQQMSFISEFAASRGQWEVATVLKQKLIDRLYADIYSLDSQRLEQLTAHYETSRLETELEKANRKARRAMIYAGVLLLILLAGGAALLLERKKKKE